MNTKLFWENVNKRMKYERTQRLQRRRKAGVKGNDSKSNQIDFEQQLQIECLLQVLEEYVTASLSQKDENYDNDRLSEDIDIISIAVQKLKKDMASDEFPAGFSTEEDDAYCHGDSPGAQLAMKVLDNLGVATVANELVERGITSSLNLKEQELDEDKENSASLPGVQQEANTRKNSGSDFSFTSNKEHFSAFAHNESNSITPTPEKSQQLYFSENNSVGAENEGKTRKDGLARGLDADNENTNDNCMEEDDMIAITDEEIVNYATDDHASELASARDTRNNLVTKISSAESNSVVPTDDVPPLETWESSQNRDSLRFLKKTKFAINRTSAEKPSVWSRKLISRSQQQNSSKLEEEMRKEKPKFNMKGDKVLQKAISSFKNNIRQQPVKEGLGL